MAWFSGIFRTVQGWLKSTRNSYLNTGSFPRNHIWMCGVLKKSIFAYLKFHICIPLPKFQRPRISESKVFPCLQCVSSDRKNQNIRHSWKRLWILTRALGHTNTGVNIRILPKIFVWLWWSQIWFFFAESPNIRFIHCHKIFSIHLNQQRTQRI